MPIAEPKDDGTTVIVRGVPQSKLDFSQDFPQMEKLILKDRAEEFYLKETTSDGGRFYGPSHDETATKQLSNLILNAKDDLGISNNVELKSLENNDFYHADRFLKHACLPNLTYLKLGTWNWRMLDMKAWKFEKFVGSWQFLANMPSLTHLRVDYVLPSTDLEDLFSTLLTNQHVKELTLNFDEHDYYPSAAEWDYLSALNHLEKVTFKFRFNEAFANLKHYNQLKASLQTVLPNTKVVFDIFLYTKDFA